MFFNIFGKKKKRPLIDRLMLFLSFKDIALAVALKKANHI